MQLRIRASRYKLGLYPLGKLINFGCVLRGV